MALETERKTEAIFNSTPAQKQKDRILLLLRLVAFLATASATIVMALNKQTITLVVATIGNNPIKASLTAKFQHTPAFVFFVVANAQASFHNLLILVLEIVGHKIDFKGLRLAIIAILDMLIVVLAAAGDGAAVFMAELGKNGNSHARWNKICDKFQTFCDHGSGALIASFIGLILLLIINIISIAKLFKPKSYNTI
ncbi:CASP-like protein 1B2 [Quercus suber]|uniref:CASP-like protein 1B2 n=1 Tax=Quercus suber TaxID=58331 RepID=UPI000CE1C488|nr:CASP-like protein 1B2 [Quercus suber]POE84863.1 casp-like protein 1b1 [Quercus suber]